ncbi:hypothetical protein QQ045_018011 [Rhodiola kirilowii]
MDISYDMLLAVFESKHDKMKVMDGGPWTGDGWAIAVGHWDVDRVARNVTPTKVPMWFQIHHLPLVLVQENHEDRFGLLISELVDVSKTSLIVNENFVQKNYLRLRILIDSTEPLADGCYVFEEDEEEPIWVDFKYERLPKYCLKCARLTHGTSSCNVRSVDGDDFPYAHLHVEPSFRDGKKDARKGYAPKVANMKSNSGAPGGVVILESQGEDCMEIWNKSNLCDLEDTGRKRDGDYLGSSNSKKEKSVWPRCLDDLYQGMSPLVFPPLFAGLDQHQPIWMPGPSLIASDPFEINMINTPFSYETNVSQGQTARVLRTSKTLTIGAPAAKITKKRYARLRPKSATRITEVFSQQFSEQEFSQFLNFNNQPYLINKETKCGSRRCEAVRIQLGFDCCFVVPARGRSSGLALFWNNITDVDVVSYSGFHIDFRLSHKGFVHITLFYGNPKASLRYKSWDLMRKLRRLIRSPWCLLGDLNEICGFSESTSSNLSRRANMEQFRQVLCDCGLMDLGYKCSKFTYSNKRLGRDEVWCRLDRAVGDELWVDRYPNMTVQHLTSHHSDHSPLFLNLDGVINV